MPSPVLAEVQNSAASIESAKSCAACWSTIVPSYQFHTYIYRYIDRQIDRQIDIAFQSGYTCARTHIRGCVCVCVCVFIILLLLLLFRGWSQRGLRERESERRLLGPCCRAIQDYIGLYRVIQGKTYWGHARVLDHIYSLLPPSQYHHYLYICIYINIYICMEREKERERERESR